MASEVQKSMYALLDHEPKLRSQSKGNFLQSLVHNHQKTVIRKRYKLSKEADRLRKRESPVNGKWLSKTLYL
jgi:hypothetical protein